MASSSGVTALSMSQLDVIRHRHPHSFLLHGAIPCITPCEGSRARGPRVAPLPTREWRCPPRPPCLVHGPCRELSPQPLHFLYQMTAVVTHPFIPSFTPLPARKHSKRSAGAILELGHKVAFQHPLSKEMSMFAGGQSQGGILDSACAPLGQSSVKILITLSKFVPLQTGLISNQQAVFPGCSEIIAQSLKRPE